MNTHPDTPASLDAATWARISPLLDEALDLPAADRTAWLAALQISAPHDAALVRGLLERQEAASREDFLAGTAHAAAGVPAAGHHLGPWTIEAPLGEGGMASVWLARRSDGRYDGQAAIKLMHGRLHGTQASQRFEREGRILARLEHPHIARLLDAGVASDGEGGQPYLVLELVRGEPIDRWCDERRLDVEARLRLFVDVVQAVAAAHAQLVVHRDLKPGNVMVDAQGQVKLLDFGIARLIDEGEDGAARPASTITRTGQRAFTPAWAAPEQVRGEPVSTATDVWALGVLLCQLLTGRHPSGLPWTSDLTAWMQAAALPDIKRPSQLASTGEDAAVLAAARGMQPQALARRLQGDLDNIIGRCLRSVSVERYGTVTALADDLRHHLAHEPVSARPDTLGYVAGKFVRRHRGAVATGLVVLLAIAGGVVGTLTQTHRANQERDRAIDEREMATGVSDFFIHMLRQSAGSDAGGLRKQLDTGRDLAKTLVLRYPLAQAAVFMHLSAIYADIDDIPNALAMMDEATRVVNTLPDPARRASNLVPLLCGRAVLLNNEARYAEGLQLLTQAQALMDAGAAADVPVDAQVSCILTNSYLRSGLGQHDAAVLAARTALKLLRDSGVDPRALISYTSSLDRALLLAGRHAEAWPLAETLARDSAATEGTNTMAALRRNSRLTHLKRVGGQPQQALALAENDLALMTRIMSVGDSDALTLYEHGRALLALSRVPEAITELQRSVDSARSKNDTLVLTRAQLALMQAWLASGQELDLVKAQALFQGERAQWQAIADRQSPSTVEVWRTQALLIAAHGDLPAARALLDRAAAFGQRLSGAEHPARLALELDQGALALAAGDANAALAHAALAQAAARRAALDPARSADMGRALWLQARCEAALKNPGAGITAGQALAQLLPTLGATHPLTRDAQQAALALPLTR